MLLDMDECILSSIAFYQNNESRKDIASPWFSIFDLGVITCKPHLCSTLPGGSDAFLFKIFDKPFPSWSTFSFLDKTVSKKLPRIGSTTVSGDSVSKFRKL